MSYCNAGDKPRVEYTSPSQGKQIFASPYSPIDVVLDRAKKNIYGNDYNAEGYTIILTNGQETTVINHRLRNGNEIQFWSCGNTDWDNRQPDGTYPIWYPLPVPIANIDQSRGCPPPIPPQDYRIQVLYQGNVIFSDISDTPINYIVSCGDCPANHIKCECPGYPGYCCIPCSEIRNGIAAATSAIRSVNNG
jgi:hypothetical protein